MARPILNTPRILRTGQPLALEAIRQAAPAVFASEPHESRGPRYAYVPTIQPLQKLLDNGWGVYEVGQQRSRDAGRDPYTKHMLRLRKLEHFSARHSDVFTDGVPEVIMINAHDGSAAYHLFGGWFRFVCSNGLIVGDTFSGFKVRHTVGPQTSAEVLEAGESILTTEFPRIITRVGDMKQVKVTDANAYRLAQKAVELRYGGTLAPFDTRELITPRRDEDRDPTLWNMLNRIQENIMDGGWETRSRLFARRSTVKPVERVSAVAKINRGLWNEAEAILEGT
jgi:hypothetical protein